MTSSSVGNTIPKVELLQRFKQSIVKDAIVNIISDAEPGQRKSEKSLNEEQILDKFLSIFQEKVDKLNQTSEKLDQYEQQYESCVTKFIDNKRADMIRKVNNHFAEIFEELSTHRNHIHKEVIQHFQILKKDYSLIRILTNEIGKSASDLFNTRRQMKNKIEKWRDCIDFSSALDILTNQESFELELETINLLDTNSMVKECKERANQSKLVVKYDIKSNKRSIAEFQKIFVPPPKLPLPNINKPINSLGGLLPPPKIQLDMNPKNNILQGPPPSNLLAKVQQSEQKSLISMNHPPKLDASKILSSNQAKQKPSITPEMKQAKKEFVFQACFEKLSSGKICQGYGVIDINEENVLTNNLSIKNNQYFGNGIDEFSELKKIIRTTPDYVGYEYSLDNQTWKLIDVNQRDAIFQLKSKIDENRGICIVCSTEIVTICTFNSATKVIDQTKYQNREDVTQRAIEVRKLIRSEGF